MKRLTERMTQFRARDAQLELERATGESFLTSDLEKAVVKKEALEMAVGVYDDTILAIRRRLRLTGRVDADIVVAIEPKVKDDDGDEVTVDDDAGGVVSIGERAIDAREAAAEAAAGDGAIEK